MLKRCDPTDSPEEVSQAVGEGQLPPAPPPSCRVMMSESKGETQPFLEKAPGGLSGPGWSEPEGRVPGPTMLCPVGAGVVSLRDPSDNTAQLEGREAQALPQGGQNQ